MCSNVSKLTVLILCSLYGIDVYVSTTLNVRGERERERERESINRA